MGRCSIGPVAAELGEVVVDVAVDDQHVGPAVVVEVGQAQPQPTSGMLSRTIPAEALTSSKFRPSVVWWIVLYSPSKLVTNSSGKPSPSRSSTSTPMPPW